MSKTRILYNDSCPICSREIKHYAQLTDDGDLPLQFDALSDAANVWGMDAETAARQLHAKRGDEVLVGVDAFVALWEEIPRYRWLARFVSLPVIRPVVGVIYNCVLAPALYAMHRRRERLTLRHD